MVDTERASEETAPQAGATVADLLKMHQEDQVRITELEVKIAKLESGQNG